MVNQKQNGGDWMLLGEFDLTPSSDPRVEITDDANGTVGPDAVRAVLHTTGDTEFVVDNTDAGVTISGSWSTDSLPAGGIPYGSNVRYATGGQGANSVTWPVDGTGGVTSAGEYQVFARWTASSNRTTDAQYQVHHAGGSTTVSVNQRLSGGTWYPLGRFELKPSQNHRVVLTDQASGRTVADAIKIVPAEVQVRKVAADAVRIVANDAEEITYVHADHLGAAQKMTDDSRAVVWDAAFTPFGELDSIIGSGTNNTRFPGQYADDETGFSYNYFRDYDPSIGRYIQSDPIGLAGGLNTYGYVFGNPVNLTDPSGQAVPFLVGFGAGVGFAVGGGLVAGHQLLCDGGINDIGDIVIGAGVGALAGAGIGLAATPGVLPAALAGAGIAARGLRGRLGQLGNGRRFEDALRGEGGRSPRIDPRDVAGKTPQQIDDFARRRGLEPKGPDPKAGKGAYVDPVTGNQRILTHPSPRGGCGGPHCHVNNPAGQRLDINGNVVGRRSPAGHLPLGGT